MAAQRKRTIRLYRIAEDGRSKCRQSLMCCRGFSTYWQLSLALTGIEARVLTGMDFLNC
jgi:hypothetical protein